MRRASTIAMVAAVIGVIGLTAAIAQTTSRQKMLFGVYRAAVVNNADPDGRHRVQIKAPSVSGQSAKWAIIAASPGAQAIPEVGDEVVVAFEHGDPDRPVVLGRVYNPG